MPDYPRMRRLLYEGKAPDVRAMTEDAIREGRPADEVLREGLVAGMGAVGEDFKRNVLYMYQVLLCARAMKAGMAVLTPLLSRQREAPGRGVVVVGTVKGDMHDIGKSLVCMMAEGAGLEVVDIGVDAPAERFVAAAREHRADVVGVSALLTTTMPYMATVIGAMREAGLRQVKICVGGAPVSRPFADEIGADGYAPDAVAAADLFKGLCAAGGAP